MAFKVGDRVRWDACRQAGFHISGESLIHLNSRGMLSFYDCDDAERIVNANLDVLSAVSRATALTPTQITELLHEAEHDIFVAEQRKRDLQAVLELVNKGYKVELPDA